MRETLIGFFVLCSLIALVVVISYFPKILLAIPIFLSIWTMSYSLGMLITGKD